MEVTSTYTQKHVDSALWCCLHFHVLELESQLLYLCHNLSDFSVVVCSNSFLFEYSHEECVFFAIYSKLFTHKHIASTFSSPSQEHFHVLALDLKDTSFILVSVSLFLLLLGFVVCRLDYMSECMLAFLTVKGVLRRQPHRRSGLATLPSVGAVP